MKDLRSELWVVVAFNLRETADIVGWVCRLVFVHWMSLSKYSRSLLTVFFEPEIRSTTETIDYGLTLSEAIRQLE
ncbi:hypothetical protein C484_18262 [Natrialba taiwanensis DSM 12281]|uniref:Uncharacterized protein n=1 Tax=Natrialba taiwanensis DSM 12281 TaxID=1230458 RepID=L9ZLL5_9EURY|nr:hypothetical protein C484_18262 [Natrialba taiwanensis DSM 12281]